MEKARTMVKRFNLWRLKERCGSADAGGSRPSK